MMSCQKTKITGLQFIELNSASVTDETIEKPAGFDIIFPGMIEYARDLNLAIPLGSQVVDALIQKRDLGLTRYAPALVQKPSFPTTFDDLMFDW